MAGAQPQLLVSECVARVHVGLWVSTETPNETCSALVPPGESPAPALLMPAGLAVLTHKCNWWTKACGFVICEQREAKHCI